MIDGIRIVLKLVRTEPFRKFGIYLPEYDYPDCRNHTKFTDNYWECLIRTYTHCAFHIAGSCKMGPTNDKEAVVDPRLKVIGVKNLRIIDASIMPILPNTNTNVPTIMIGEKGSDMIKEDWNILSK